MASLTAVWGNRQRLLRALSISMALLCALYLGMMVPLNQSRSIASSKATGLASSTGDYDKSTAMVLSDRHGAPSGVVGGVPGGVPEGKPGGIMRQVEPGSTDDRKVIRNGSLALIVAHPAESVERATEIALRHLGYVIQSQVSGQREYETGAITIRVPAAQFDAVRQELKGLAKSVEQEGTSAEDVTMHFAENEATLRNYRAEEVSYIEIMKRSGKIKDTLEVAQQLSDVRGRIERLAAEIRTMNLQSEMTAITVSLRTEPMIVTGNSWRPAYQLRLAWNEGMDGLADYATNMMAFVLRLPAVIAWVFTLLGGLKLGWWLLRKSASALGIWKSTPTPVVQ